MVKQVSATTASVPWTEEDIETLLCILDFHIEEIRSATLKDPRSGLVHASQLVSDAIGNGCTPNRVERKIRHLWTNWGKQDGKREPYEICLYGAFTTTLPGIDLSTMANVALRVREMQR
jgi:hypothetical protein